MKFSLKRTTDTPMEKEASTSSSEKDAEEAVTSQKGLSAKELEDDIPDTFTGWGLSSVFGCALMNFNTWGSNSAFALYFQNFLNDRVFPGVNKVEFGMVGGLCFASGLLFCPLINYMVGMIGIKRTIMIGTVIQFAGVLMASFAARFWELALTQGVLQGVGMALIANPCVIIIPQWFKGGRGGKRNLASGMQAAGSGLGGIVYNIGMEPIMAKHGWQWALRTQAIMCFVLNLIAVLMVRTRAKQIKPIYKVYDRTITRNFGSWMMISWVVFTMLGYVVLMYNLGDFTRSLGYGSSEASVVSTMVAVGIVWGRPLMGFVMDYMGPIQATSLASILVAILCFAMWLPCKNYGTAIAFALVQGGFMGTIWVGLSTICAEVIGLRKIGIGIGLMMISCAVCGLISPIIGISLKSGGPPSRFQYRNPTIFVGCCYIGATICLALLRGWIIVRERMAKEGATEQEKLELRVPVRDGLKSVFDLRHYRV